MSGKFSVILCFYVALVGYALHVFYWTPTPLSASVPASQFSEERARDHVSVLTERIGVRSVSTPGLQAAHHYIWGLTQDLQAAAQARGDVIVQTAFENYTGSTDFDFVGERFINAYHNISNIILHISKQGLDHLPAVLLVAHHDSPVASPGAGDDASNIGVMLELAHNLLATPAEQLPPVPVMFLFSGAEEPLCQSAAAFMKFSPWASRAGVFINLESIGPGGSPIIFQHAGAWTIEAFAKGAVHPRGAIAAQDMFDAGLVLGDTDYRQLSYKERGQLPGIDIVYLLSGAAYHTQIDTLDLIRPGVLQETGQAMTAGIRSLATVIAAAAATTNGDAAPAADAPGAAAGAAGAAGSATGGYVGSTQQQATLQELLEPQDHKRMFVSIAGTTTVTYSVAVAKLLHNMPLALVLTAPHTLQLLSPSTALPPKEGLAVVFASGARTLVTMLLVLGVPAGLGALRAVLSGTAMIWFAHPVLGFAMYFPIAAAMLLLPWSHIDYASGKGLQLLPYHTLGAALFNSVVAAGLTQLGAGTAMMFAMWGGAGVLVALCLTQGVTYASLICALASAALPVYACSESALVLSIVMMSRMSLTGHIFAGLGDAIVGLLLGLGAISLTGGIVLPLFQVLMGKRTARRLAGGFIVVGLLVATGCSVAAVFPYSASMPKRLILVHQQHTEPVLEAASDPFAVPTMRVVNSSWVFGGTDSNPVQWLATSLGFDPAKAVSVTGHELMLIFPVSKLMDVLKFPDPAGIGQQQQQPEGLEGSFPYVRRIKPQQDPQSGPAVMFSDVHLEVVAPRPCWGTLKFVGEGISAWSIKDGEWHGTTDFLQKEHSGSAGNLMAAPTYSAASRSTGFAEASSSNQTLSALIIKFTNEHQEEPLHWRIVVRVQRDADQQQQQEGPVGLTAELHVGDLTPTPELTAVEQRMPKWSTLSYRVTTYDSYWEL